MDTKRIAIITDSGTNVPPDFVAEHNIRITPLRINYSDGSSYESGITMPLMTQKPQGTRVLFTLLSLPDFPLPAILLE